MKYERTRIAATETYWTNSSKINYTHNNDYEMSQEKNIIRLNYNITERIDLINYEHNRLIPLLSFR